MTDHRLTNLSYGVLGKPTYESGSGWSFSVELSLDQTCQQLLPIREHIPGSAQPDDVHQNKHAAQSHLYGLAKDYPELIAAGELATSLALSNKSPKPGSEDGSLLSVGRAVDHHKASGSRAPLILAMPCGDAGHLLRLVRPSLQRLGWENDNATALSVFSFESSDQGIFEVGTGGIIKQIVFANEESSEETWLAIRQHDAITIFRVVYSTDSSPAPPQSPAKVSPMAPSNIKPQSVVTLTASQTSTESYVDITFNPLYTRQFAVVDTTGNWSIWDIEGRHGQGLGFSVVAGKAGGTLDDYVSDLPNKFPVIPELDVWYRILWVCNVSTILICSRRHLAVFDLESKPVRLNSEDFMKAIGFDLILDIKRSASDNKHVFVLTTSKIYWLEITLPRKASDYEGRVKILISYKHFQEPDGTMRLATIRDDYISVLMYSGTSSLVTTYCFSTNFGNLGQPGAIQGSFLLLASPRDNLWGKPLKSTYFLPLDLDIVSPDDPNLGFLNGNVRFFQPWFLANDLSLSESLFSFRPQRNTKKIIKAPTTKLSRSTRILGPKHISESFITADTADDVELPFRTRKPFPQNKKIDDLLMDWRNVYKHVVLRPDSEDTTESSDDIGALLNKVSKSVELGMQRGTFSMGTLLQLSRFSALSENLEQAAEKSIEFFKSLPLDSEEINFPSNLILSNLTQCPGVSLSNPTEKGQLELMKIYELLVDNWIATLPIEVSNAIRGAKFKIVRQVAVELYLSSFAISLQDKSSKIVPGLIESAIPAGENPDDLATRESSPATFHSSRMSVIPEDSSQTNTPSHHSGGTSASGARENPAITRLRQYSSSIKPRLDLSQSKILSEWPLTPRISPETYTYQPPEVEDSDEETQKAKREAARRKKRTEKFLQRNAETVSQASMTPFGSQPPEPHQLAFSSQPAEDLPMTQPDRGVFGSRPSKGKKKHQRKHRAAGFK